MYYWNVIHKLLILLFTGDRFRRIGISAIMYQPYGNTKCGYIFSPWKTGQRGAIQCRESVYGNEIKIKQTFSKDTPLTLCEVEVYAYLSKTIFIQLGVTAQLSYVLLT